MTENFEKYWKEKFDKFQIEPSAKLWKKLDDSLFEKQTQLLFKRYLVRPSKSVWRKIYFALWWKEFTKFSTTTFNIYYFLTSILIAIGVITYSYRYEHLQSKFEKTYSNSEQNINNTRSLSLVLDDKKQFNLSENLISTSKKNLYKKQRNNNVISTPQSLFLYNEKENIPSIASIGFSEFIKTPDSLKFIGRMDGYNLKKHSHSFALYSSFILLNHSFYFQKTETFKGIPLFKLLDASAYGISAWYSYQQNNFSFSSGIIFQSAKQHYAYNNPLIFNDTIRTEEIIDQSYYQYSYIQVLNLDTLLLTGDTVWITHVDSTLVVQLDTLWSTEIKEIRKNREARHYFSYKTIELPVLFGYTQMLDRLSLTFKTGISLSHTILTSGTFISANSEYGNMPFIRQQFKWLHLNALFAIEAQYALSEKWSVAMMPMYKRNITNLLKESLPMQLKANSWFINVGIKYHLP